MKVGALGDIVFEVSTSMIQTIQESSWKGSANIQSHQRHLNKALQEYVGCDSDTFTFSMLVTKHLGADPLKVISKLQSYERTGKILKLTLGTKSYGQYRWLLQKHSVNNKHFDKKGNLIGAEISVTLIEYVKE